MVITGLGVVSACGIGKEAFWQNIRTGRSGIGPVTAFDAADCGAKCAGEVRDWDPRDFIRPHKLKRFDRYVQFAVSSGLLALEDAALPWSRERPQERAGVSFGTGLGGIAHAEGEHARYLQQGMRAVNPVLALQVFGGSAHSNLAIEFGFRGVGHAIEFLRERRDGDRRGPAVFAGRLGGRDARGGRRGAAVSADFPCV